VLKPFTGDEKKQLTDVFERAKESIEVLVSEGLEKAMNRFN
jgi:peptidyl-tRNA hydrolase